MLGLHLGHLLGLGLLQGFQVALLILKIGLLGIEVGLDAAHLFDDRAIAGVDLVDVMRVGDQVFKRRGVEQQHERVGAAVLIRLGNAIAQVVLLFLELGLLLVDLGLRRIDLGLHVLDLVKGLVLRLGKRRVLVSDVVQLLLDGVELGLRIGKLVERLLGGTRRRKRRNGIGGQKRRDTCQPKKRLHGLAARKTRLFGDIEKRLLLFADDGAAFGVV